MVINRIISFPKPALKSEITSKTGLCRHESESDAAFGRELAEALNQTAGQVKVSPETCQIISLENQRALNAPQGLELAEAAELLRALTAAVAASPKGTLENIHRLEGLVQYYRV